MGRDEEGVGTAVIGLGATAMAATPRRQISKNRPGRRGFLRGVLETLSMIAGFVAIGAIGAVWAAVETDPEGRDESAGSVYAGSTMASEDPQLWLLDGYNVLHAGILGGRDRSQWWTESRRRELLERAARFDARAEVWIVFDGREDPADASDGGASSDPRPRCIFAPSADDWLVEQVRRADRPERITVVTADRRVAGRVQGRGAQVVSPGAFLARCNA
jgi:predicted RNA-binding protein with PIN domain